MVRCAKCGLLALRRTNGEVEAADEGYRRVGASVLGGGQHHPMPLCFAQALDFRAVFKTEHPSPSEVVDVIIADRECQEWTGWRFGHTPKEHREMMDRQRLLEFQTKREDDWQQWQARMAVEDKEWKEEQEHRAEERHREQVKTIQDIHKREMLIMGVVVTVAILLVTVVGSAIEADWIPKWFGLFG